MDFLETWNVCLIRLISDYVALETHSETFCLRPAVGFLQSGSKLLFRRRRREKEACLSQSHEDISNMGNSFNAASAGSRKTSGSFSRRLIKHFSFRSSGKSKAKATSTNGGSSPLGNWSLFCVLAPTHLRVTTVKRTLSCKVKTSNRLNTPGGLAPVRFQRRKPLVGLCFLCKVIIWPWWKMSCHVTSCWLTNRWNVVLKILRFWCRYDELFLFWIWFILYFWVAKIIY